MIRKLIFIYCLSILFMCTDDGGDGDECAPNQNGVEVVYPKGGETFKVSEAITIQWKVNPDKIKQVQVQISLDNQTTWKVLYERGVTVTGSGNGECMDTIWTIGSEFLLVNYDSTNTVIFRVGDYNNTEDINDISGTFTVVK